jgi:creatinine amidohydrolase
VVDWTNTFREIERAAPRIAVMTIGAIEQHSDFMPVGTDFLMGDHFSRRIAEKLDAYLLPTLPFSNSQEHQDFAGTVWLRPDTLAQVVRDLCTSLRHHGIRKVLILDHHGGNWVLKPTVRDINLNDPDMRVILSGPGTAVAAMTGTEIELHCGTQETSWMMSVFPDMVDDGKRRDCQPGAGREWLDYVGMHAVSPTGVWGHPTRASAGLGERLIAEMVENIVTYARETFARFDEIRRAAPPA